MKRIVVRVDKVTVKRVTTIDRESFAAAVRLEVTRAVRDPMQIARLSSGNVRSIQVSAIGTAPVRQKISPGMLAGAAIRKGLLR